MSFSSGFSFLSRKILSLKLDLIQGTLALGRIGGRLAVDRLIDMVRDPDIQYDVWVSIGFTADQSAIPVLKELLRVERSTVNYERLIITLARCGDHSRLDDLKDIVESSEYPGHVYNASELIRSLSKMGELVQPKDIGNR